MIDVLEPRNEKLKQFVDSIYIFKKGNSHVEFTAYPSVNTPVGLMRNATINVENNVIHIDESVIPNYSGVVCNQFSSLAYLQYRQLVDEIAINFKPLGFSTYTRLKPGKSKIFLFSEWNKFLPGLFRDVFETENGERQLYFIEQFLLMQYKPLPNEDILLNALELLGDIKADYKMEEIASLLSIHYKQFYRQFIGNVGCSPAHYRKLLKFRNSVVSKVKKGDTARLTDVCYEHEYADQAFFIRQFKELTGNKPTRFFKDITSFGNEKVILKID